jgi:hypothetical protein
MKTKTLSVDELMGLSKAVRNGDTVMKAAKPAGSFSEEQRSMRFIMSAEVADRDGDIVVINGVDTEHFEKNPVALWGHNSMLMTGGWQDIAKISGRPKRLEGTHVWAEAGTSPEVDKTFSLARQGFLRACSVGFMPVWKEAEGLFDDEDRFMGIKFNASQLLECSICPIPANQLALGKMAETEDGRLLANEIMEQVLDNWPKTAAGIFMSHSEYAAHLKTVQGEKTVTTITAPKAEDGASKVDEEGLLSKIAKAFGLKRVEKSPVEPKAPESELPRLATAEEKAAAQARAEAALQRAQSTLTQGV